MDYTLGRVEMDFKKIDAPAKQPQWECSQRHYVCEFQVGLGVKPGLIGLARAKWRIPPEGRSSARARIIPGPKRERRYESRHTFVQTRIFLTIARIFPIMRICPSRPGGWALLLEKEPEKTQFTIPRHPLRPKNFPMNLRQTEIAPYQVLATGQPETAPGHAHLIPQGPSPQPGNRPRAPCPPTESGEGRCGRLCGRSLPAGINREVVRPGHLQLAAIQARSCADPGRAPWPPSPPRATSQAQRAVPSATIQKNHTQRTTNKNVASAAKFCPRYEPLPGSGARGQPTTIAQENARKLPPSAGARNAGRNQ